MGASTQPLPAGHSQPPLGSNLNPYFVHTLPSRPDDPTENERLWEYIKTWTTRMEFNTYKTFIDGIMCCDPQLTRGCKEFELRLPFPGVDSYTLLKVATQVFLACNCGCVSFNPCCKQDDGYAQEKQSKGGAKRCADDSRLGQDPAADDALDGLLVQLSGLHSGISVLPYIKEILSKFTDIPLKPDGPSKNCSGLLVTKLQYPCLLELIWSYWHEEGMLVQSMNAIGRRFQNLRGTRASDPLSRLDLSPLRPLNNLLWAYIQDEQHRLTVIRRAYEYDHHYGLRLMGKAVPDLQPADSRSKFLAAFHALLNQAWEYYRERSDTNVVPDGFPLLNALKEVHLLLAEGAHNQFGDLPWTARHEMFMQQWILARPELRDFLGGRAMVPYTEAWMDRVDSMNRMQGWTDVTVTHFRDLGVYGEQILLGARYGNWNTINTEQTATAWADAFRPQVQGYIHAYRAVTGADLTATPVSSRLPAQLIRQRLTAASNNGQQPAALPSGAAVEIRSRSNVRR